MPAIYFVIFVVGFIWAMTGAQRPTLPLLLAFVFLVGAFEAHRRIPR